MTGCRYFDEYMREILPVRYKLFQKLLQEGKKPKIIFCFVDNSKMYFNIDSMLSKFNFGKLNSSDKI